MEVKHSLCVYSIYGYVKPVFLIVTFVKNYYSLVGDHWRAKLSGNKKKGEK